MSTGNGKLTDKQTAFIAWYVKLLNATRAAQRAGYEGDNDTLRVTGSRLLANANVRAELDKRLTASIPAANETLSRIGSQAHADIGDYYKDDGTLDLERLKADGLSHLVIGAQKSRDGVNWSLASPQTAQKMLARYHRLLGADTQVDVTASLDLGPDAIDALAAQIAAARDSAAEQSDTQE